jgi:Ran GTPase-activating protein (RanGAP) involved in mRNA processing and transport
MVVRNRRLLVDLNFSENKIGDANMPMVCHVMMELRDTLEKVHLNENGITEKGAQDLCGALERMKTLKVLRLNGNPLRTRGAELILQVRSCQKLSNRQMS